MGPLAPFLLIFLQTSVKKLTKFAKTQNNLILWLQNQLKVQEQNTIC